MLRFGVICSKAVDNDGEGDGTPLQRFSILVWRIPMDRGAWWATVHGGHKELDKTEPWRREWQPTPVLLPGKSHGQRSLAGYSP